MRFLCYIFIAAIVLSSCRERPKVRTQIDGHALGTYYRVIVVSDKAEELKAEIDSLFRVADNSMSIYNPSSLLSRINRNETDSLDRNLAICIETALKVTRESGGCFDITVKPLVEAYGFAGTGPAVYPDIDSLRRLVGYDKISIRDNRLVKADPRVQLDLNAIAKGYITDYLARYMESKGFKDCLVEIGGEIYASGTNEHGKWWKIGVDLPQGEMMQTKIGLSGKGMATSGNYRKFYVDKQGRTIVHTINPLTGEPRINDLIQATVIAENVMLADAYATSFMVMGYRASREFLEKRPDLGAILVYRGASGGSDAPHTTGAEMEIYYTKNTLPMLSE